MGDYNSFLAYANERTDEIIYDATQGLFFEEGVALSQEDIKVISKLSLKLTYAVLRQCDEWKSGLA